MTQSLLSAGLLVVAGILAGASACVAWERVSAWRQMSLEAFSTDFRRSLRRMDPTMPILAVITIVLGTAFAFGTSGRSRVLAGVAVVTLLVMLVFTLAVLEPMNSVFRRASEGEVPERAASIRTQWGQLHVARASLIVAVFVLFVIAVAIPAA